jgi:hypothetical protein
MDKDFKMKELNMMSLNSYEADNTALKATISHAIG